MDFEKFCFLAEKSLSFSKPEAKSQEILPINLDFLHQNSIIRQYKHHIRNQHQKPSRTICITSLFNHLKFFRIFASKKSLKFWPKTENQSNISKHISSDLIFDADFDYDIYIA